MVGSARENFEPQECRQEGTKTCLHGFLNGRVFRDSKVVDSAVLEEITLTAREVLSHRVSSQKLDQLENQERRDIEVLSRRNLERKKELETAKTRIMRGGGDVRGSGEGLKRRTARIESSIGSGRRPDATESSEVRSPARKKGR